MTYISDILGRLINTANEKYNSTNLSNISNSFNQRVPNTTDASVKQDSTVHFLESTPETNIYYYPEEINHSLSKNGVRNIIKIGIHDIEGGAISNTIISKRNDIAGLNDKNLIRNVYNYGFTGFKDLAGKVITGVTKDAPKKLADFVVGNLEGSPDAPPKLIDDAIFQELSNTGKVTLKKPSTLMYLHTPNDLNMSYGIQYNEEDMTSTYRLLDIMNMLTNNTASPEIADILVQLGINLGQSVADAIVPGFLNYDGKGVDLPALFKAKARLAPLLNKEYLFERVKRRAFEFKFKFYPRSKLEIEHVGKIIAALKYYAHPELLGPQSRYLKAPSVFTIQHYVNTGDRIQENLFINRINTCILENIKVNYSDVGVNSTLKDQHLFQEYGFKSPVGIDLSLSFKEMVLLTRDDFTKDSEFFNPQKDDGRYH